MIGLGPEQGASNALPAELLIELVRDHVKDLLAVIDSNRTRIWHNEAYSSALGYTREELAGADSFTPIHPEDVALVSEVFETAMKTGETQRVEYRMGHRDGRWLTLESRARTVEIPGCGRCLILVARDITERKFLEQRLQSELEEAGRYVRAVLPAEFQDPQLEAHWTFVPSTSLGGDSFTYRWVDSEHFAFGLIDVCGHGVGAALLSISAANVLRSGLLPGTDFNAPEQVLKELNAMFPMEEHGNQFFSAWYGVYHAPSRILRCASAGHPAPVIFPSGNGDARPEELSGSGPAIGMTTQVDYTTREIAIPEGTILYLFSDGVYEVQNEEEVQWDYNAFLQTLKPTEQSPSTEMTRIFKACQDYRGQELLDDDYSMVRFCFT